MTKRTLLAGFVALGVAACSGSYQVVQIPHYEADLHPLSQTKAGITIAIDEMKRPERVERFFGADLTKENILPVNVVVSNFSKQRLVVKPSDILLYRGKEVIDPLPIESVVAAAQRQHGSVSSKTQRDVEKFFESATFKEMVLAPGENYRGVMFFAVPAPKTGLASFFRTLYVYRDAGPRIRVGLTNYETGERILFGPFSVALLDNAGA